MSVTPGHLTRLHHIGVPVWDADSVALFYEEAGVPVVSDEILDEYNIRAVFLDVDGVYVELLEPTSEGNVKTFLERYGPGYQHVAYQVPNIDAAMAAFRERGVTFKSNDPLPGAGGTRIAFVEERHTGGLQTELVEDESVSQ